MKALTWMIPCALLLGAAFLAFGSSAGADDRATAGWEYKHVLIPLDRQLRTYEKSDVTLLAPIQKLGAEGWELVTVNEPPSGFTINSRASVEFWLKRRR